MSKTIKLDDQVYQDLEEFRDKRQTFSEAVENLLGARAQFCQLINVLEGRIRFEEWKRQKAEKPEAG